MPIFGYLLKIFFEKSVFGPKNKIFENLLWTIWKSCFWRFEWATIEGFSFWTSEVMAILKISFAYFLAKIFVFKNDRFRLNFKNCEVRFMFQNDKTTKTSFWNEKIRWKQKNKKISNFCYFDPILSQIWNGHNFRSSKWKFFNSGSFEPSKAALSDGS